MRGFLKEIRQSMASEWAAMMSGHFVPYQKLAILVALITSFAFSIALSHDVVLEAPVAVVDLDQSRWSAELVEKLNASPNLSVKAVVHSPSDPRAMTRGDRFVGVVYIPKGAEARMLRGDRTLTIGYFADDSNTAQNGEVYSVLNKIAAELGAEQAVSRADGVSSLGKNTNETGAMMSPLRVGFRYLTNPTGQAATATVVSFLLFFSMMYHGLVSLMLVGRLRVTRSWDAEVLTGSVFGFLARAVPYAFIFTSVVTVALAVMILLGQLRFAGNILLFIPALFLCALGNTWLAYLLSWGTTNPGQGAGRMIFLVPSGFILGGATMATGFMHGWVHDISFGIPLVWLFNFWRDQGLRGIDGQATLPLFGGAILWLIFLGSLNAIRFWRDEARRRKELRQYWHDLQGVPNREAGGPAAVQKAAASQ